jgi:hypothetical protein
MFRYLAVATLIFALSAQSSASNASNGACSAAISADGVSAHVEGSADFERYHGHVPEGLAKSRAIAAWQQKVASDCAGFSAKWWRAKAASVECDAGMGHDYCTATAVPARKLLGFLLRN